jgi:putative ABC transport system permease protein
MAYSVGQRMKEFGIRLALGAPPKRVFTSILAHGLALAGTGVVIGLVGSWALTLFIRSLLFETDRLDPAVYISATILLLGAATLACWIPSKRASRADLSTLLRAE